MNLTIGKITKRVNSTKFSYDEGTTVTLTNVRLKEPTDLKNPTFLLTRVNGQKDLSKCNYCNALGRFYWITNIIYSTNDLIEVVCTTDILATGSKYLRVPAYVQYTSDSDYKNDFKLTDPRLGPDRPPIVKELDLNDIDGTLDSDAFVVDPRLGTYIVRCLAKDKGLVSYALDQSSFKMFYKEFVGSSGLNTVDDFLSKTFGDNWRNAFASAYYIPVYPSAVKEAFGGDSSVTSEVKIGTLSLTVGPTPCTTEGVCYICRSTVADLPIDAKCTAVLDAVKFLRGSAFTKVEFDYPGGNTDLSVDDFIESPYLYVEESLDVMSGEYSLNFYTADSNETYTVKKRLIAKISTKLGADVTELMQRQSTSEFWTDVGSAAVRSLPAIATGGAAAAVTGIAGAFTHASMGVNAHSCYVSGGLTNYFRISHVTDYWDTHHFSIRTSVSLPEIFFNTSTDAQAVHNATDYQAYVDKYGYFVNDWIDLSTLKDGSYVQAVGASLGDKALADYDTRLFNDEIATLNNLLAQGIYLEDWSQA